MKKLLSILILALLFTACGKVPVEEATVPAETLPAETAASETASAENGFPVYNVSTVDEFLAALGSERTIVLAPGSYDLTQAADYGTDPLNLAYRWIDMGDGHQLTLLNIHDTVIRGSGMDSTSILTDPRYANVLELSNCSGIRLEDFTAGHTVRAELCTGGVIRLTGCEETTLENLGLYGCGIIGVNIEDSWTITVKDCDIYDCSVSGVSVYSSDRVHVDSCRIHNMGHRDQIASAFFIVNFSADVYISDCTMEDSLMDCLLVSDGGENLSFHDCSIRNNRVRSSAFCNHYSFPVFENVTLEGNQVRRWYEDGGEHILDPEGNPIESFQTSEEAPALAEQKQVTVTTVDEFLNAIDNDTQIILEGEVFDLTTATGYGEGGGEHWYWDALYADGPTLVLCDLTNFSITSDGDRDSHTFLALPRYADVLSLERCSDVTLSGFTAGHTEAPQPCSGGVLWLEDCDRITVDNCDLYGCGTIGINAYYCGDLSVTGCEIHDCTDGGLYLFHVTNANIDDTVLRDLGSFRIRNTWCENITVDGKPAH